MERPLRRLDALIQPVFLFELSGQMGLDQVAEVLGGQRVELVLEQLLGPADVLVVELDAGVAREALGIGNGAGEADELGLGDGHPLALERKVDQAG